MTTLSEDKIRSLLSIPGNNKCLECEKTPVECASFPTAIFLCSQCGKEHNQFKKSEIVKSLSISDFTEKEMSILSIGGNDRYLSLLNEYNIPISEPNIECKYCTFATAYYNALLEAELNKMNNISNSEETLNKLINRKPPIQLGKKLMGDTPDYYMELIKTVSTSTGGFGGLFGFIGNKIYNVTEQLGINKVYKETKNTIDSKLNEYGIKEKMAKGYDYCKSAGEYIVDKTKEIASSDVLKGTVDKVKEGVDYVNKSASNMIKNLSGDEPNNNNISNNNAQESNLGFLNSNNNQNVYEQLNNDQL